RSRHDRGPNRPEGGVERGATRAAPGSAGAPAGLHGFVGPRAGVRFAAARDGEVVFDSQLRVCWGGGRLARLLPSGDILAPKVEALASDLLDGPAREEVRKRAATWVETRVRLGLSELMDARATTELPAGARGIVF